MNKTLITVVGVLIVIGLFAVFSSAKDPLPIPPEPPERSASRPYHLEFERAARAFTGIGEFDVVRISAVTGALRLANGESAVQTSNVYILVGNRLPDGWQHVGKIAYRPENEGEWRLFELERTTQITFGSTYTRFNNIASTTAADAGMEILYVPERATAATFTETRILIQGVHVDASEPFPDSWSGNIQIVDGYNSTSGQGGTWQIPFDSTSGIGFMPWGRTQESYRSIYYSYYVGNGGPFHSTSLDNGVAWPSEIRRYQASVRRQYRSPAATAIIQLTPNALELLQPPGYISRGDLYVGGFEFQCQDNDAEQDIYRRGTITMLHVRWLFIPYDGSVLRDRCDAGVPPSESEEGAFSSLARISQFRCEDNLPVEVPETSDCPTPSCNAFGNACAREPVSFTCTDTDADAVDPAYAYGQVRVRSSGGGTWTYRDSCTWRDGVFGVSEYSCRENGVAVSSVTECPAGCEWQGGDPYVYIGRCIRA